MAVRLDKNLRATIDKVVASYNSKITRYKKQGYITPEKTSFKQIASLGSRASIKRELKLLQNLSKKTLDKYVYNGILTNKYEESYFKKKIQTSKRLLRNRIKKISEIEFKTAGKKAGFTYGDRFNLLYGDLDSALKNGQLRNDKLISNMRKFERIATTSYGDYLQMSEESKNAFMSLLNRVENPYVNPRLRDSYIESLTDLGYAYGYDKDKLAILEKKIKSLSPEEFEKVFSEDLAMQRVFSYYDILKMNTGTNIMDNKDDVFNLYDTLYANIDEIIK